LKGLFVSAIQPEKEATVFALKPGVSALAILFATTVCRALAWRAISPATFKMVKFLYTGNSSSIGFN
jgi:hypothetical protein